MTDLDVPMGTYAASPIRRRRATMAEMQSFRMNLWNLVRRGEPMTVRHAFYRAVASGLVEKSERSYNKVQRELVKMRRDWWRLRQLAGDLDNDDLWAGWPHPGTDDWHVRAGTVVPFSWIADNTRWTRKPETYDSMQAALKNTAETYRRALWSEAAHYVEVWCESDSIAGVIADVTAEWDVPLQVVRGFSSITYLYGAAQAIAETGKPAFLYYFGDYDKAGTDIDRNVEKDLREFAPDADITFERTAITAGLIEEWNLPTKPSTKHKSFPNTVELEALPPDLLRDLVRTCITAHVDEAQLDVILTAEESERSILDEIASTKGGAA